MEKLFDKVFNGKNAKWVMFGCACFLAVCQILTFVSNIGNEYTSKLVLIASFLWAAVVLGLIIYGLLANKENFFNCGMLLSLSYLITAFTNGFNYLYNFINLMENEVPFVYGVQSLVSCFISLCVATAFVLWLLGKFFNKNVKDCVIKYLTLIVVILAIVNFVLLIITEIAYEAGFGISEFLTTLCPVAYVGLFAAYLYKNNKDTKTEPKEEVKEAE